MTKTIQAIYENGVFRPVEPFDLPEKTPVELEVKTTSHNSAPEKEPPAPSMSEGLAKIYAILGERYASGHSDTAARHNEHQP